MTHTPGPWKYDSISGYIVDREGNAIGEVRGWGRLSTLYGEKKAVKIQDLNGYLIAAAPELLKALRDCHNILINDTTPADEYFDAVKLAEEAIAKAREAE